MLDEAAHRLTIGREIDLAAEELDAKEHSSGLHDVAETVVAHFVDPARVDERTDVVTGDTDLAGHAAELRDHVELRRLRGAEVRDVVHEIEMPLGGEAIPDVARPVVVPERDAVAEAPRRYHRHVEAAPVVRHQVRLPLFQEASEVAKRGRLVFAVSDDAEAADLVVAVEPENADDDDLVVRGGGQPLDFAALGDGKLRVEDRLDIENQMGPRHVGRMGLGRGAGQPAYGPPCRARVRLIPKEPRIDGRGALNDQAFPSVMCVFLAHSARLPVSEGAHSSLRRGGRRAQIARVNRAFLVWFEQMARNILVINVDLRETRVALIENGVIAELQIERAAHRGSVGNIVLGKVTRVLPGMQAAFIDIGMERAAFLHVEDLIRPDDFDAYLAGGATRSDEDGDETIRGEAARRADYAQRPTPDEDAEDVPVVERAHDAAPCAVDAADPRVDDDDDEA